MAQWIVLSTAERVSILFKEADLHLENNFDKSGCVLGSLRVYIDCSQPLTRLSGIVSDSNGAAMPNATVEFHSKDTTIRTSTNAQGSFTIVTTTPEGTLLISSPAFFAITLKVSTQTINESIHIQLDPLTLIERIVVVANEEEFPQHRRASIERPRNCWCLF